MYLQNATPAAVITDKSTSTDDAPANRNSQDLPRTSTRREESGKSWTGTSTLFCMLSQIPLEVLNLSSKIIPTCQLLPIQL